METSLLHDDDDQVDLLPVNTQIFSSTVQYGRLFWSLALSLCTVFPFLLILTAAFNHGAKTGYAVTVVILGLIAAGIAVYIAVRQRATYAEHKRRGEWHEGIIVFPTGDIVARFQHLFRTIDLTIENVYLNRAAVEPGFCLKRCSTRQYLAIYYLDIDGRAQRLSIVDVDLVDNVYTIAEHINQLKSKTVNSPL